MLDPDEPRSAPTGGTGRSRSLYRRPARRERYPDSASLLADAVNETSSPAASTHGAAVAQIHLIRERTIPNARDTHLNRTGMAFPLERPSVGYRRIRVDAGLRACRRRLASFRHRRKAAACRGRLEKKLDRQFGKRDVDRCPEHRGGAEQGQRSALRCELQRHGTPA